MKQYLISLSLESTTSSDKMMLTSQEAAAIQKVADYMSNAKVKLEIEEKS